MDFCEGDRKMILVSACLLGNCCRYDGNHMKNDEIIDYLKDKEYVVICPEVMSGMMTPRLPSEILGNKVMARDGKDVTDYFERGAQLALMIAKEHNCHQAILKDASPSCGSTLVYDGSFTGRKIKGQGITARLLSENGIEIISSEEFS